MFSASSVQVTEEGLIFVCSDELEAQKAFLEGQARGRRVKIDGKNLIMLNSDRTYATVTSTGVATPRRIPKN
jgi:hypothetical protein